MFLKHICQEGRRHNHQVTPAKHEPCGRRSAKVIFSPAAVVVNQDSSIKDLSDQVGWCSCHQKGTKGTSKDVQSIDLMRGLTEAPKVQRNPNYRPNIRKSFNDPQRERKFWAARDEINVRGRIAAPIGYQVTGLHLLPAE
jgi:hypothetical protein